MCIRDRYHAPPRGQDRARPIDICAHERRSQTRSCECVYPCAKLSMPCSPWQQTIGERIERVRWRERHLIDRVRMRGRCTRGLEHRLAQYELVNFVGDPTCRHECDEQITQPEEHESKTAVGVDRRSGGLNRPEQTEGDNGPRHNISHDSLSLI